jgi:aminopeptidase N
MPIKKIETVYYGYNMELWRDEFEESVEMSTYLVAFVICDFESISNKTNKNVEVAIHTPHGLLNQAHFALQTAVQLMDYYDDFFGVAYPLPKQGKYLNELIINAQMQLSIILNFLFNSHYRFNSDS